MPRLMAAIKPIATGTACRRTFKNRKASLLKKAMELSTLCNVDMCAIISEGPHDCNPEMWPKREDAMPIISRFCGMSGADKSKKMVDRVRYLFQQMKKLQLQLQKVESENRELETAILLHEVLSGQSSTAKIKSFEQISGLATVVEKRLGDIHNRMHNMVPVPVPAPVPHHAAPNMAPMVAVAGPQVDDKMEKFFDTSVYGCDDEITALLFA